MARGLRGSYVRNSEDWYRRELCFVGVASGAGAGTFASVALYNNTAEGEYLHVVGLSFNNFDTANGIVMSPVHGVPGITIGNPGLSVYLDGAAPSGQSYFSNGGPAFTTYLSQLGALPGPCNIFTAWPLVVIPPGWALWFQPDTANKLLGGTIWYLTLLD